MQLLVRLSPLTVAQHCRQMNYISVGGLELPQMGLGTFPLRGEVLRKTLDCAVGNGYGLIDTAYKYQNEDVIGEFIENHNTSNNPIIVQTKFSVTQLTYKKFLCFKYGRKTTADAINGSIDRLRKQSLDVYLLHAPSNGYTGYYADLKRFREQGKAKVIGVCRFSEKQLQDIKETSGEYPAINQIEVHPFHTNKRVIDFCKRHDIVVEARSVLTHGDAMDRLSHSEVLKKIAADCGRPIPQVIIRWIVQQGLIAIVKSETPGHVKDNVEVFDFYLTERQMSLIDSLNKDESFGCVSKMLGNHGKCN